MKNKCILFLLVFSYNILHAQDIIWEQVFGSQQEDAGFGIVHSSDNTLVVAGFNNSQIYLSKLDLNGNLIWEKFYGFGVGTDVKQTSDGGYIISGTVAGPNPFLLKTDSQGNTEWFYTYDYLGGDDRAHSVILTSDGGYLLVGQTWILNGSFGSYDMYVVKTNASGIAEWKKNYSYESYGNDLARCAIQLSDGGFIIGGHTQSTSWSAFLVKLDGSGNVIWKKVYMPQVQSQCHDLLLTSDGNMIIAGTTYDYSQSDALLIKADLSGNLIWFKKIGTPGEEIAESIVELNDGGFAAAGITSNYNFSWDVYIIRTDASGNLLWHKNSGGDHDDRGFGLAVLNDNSLVTAGWSWSYSSGYGGDIYLVKFDDSKATPVELTDFTASVYDREIILRWTTASEINNEGFEIERSSGESSFQKIGFLAGKGTTTEQQLYEFKDVVNTERKVTYRLKQIDYNGDYSYSSEVEVSINLPLEFSLNQNYPNPFNPSTEISYSIAEESRVILKVYNLIGQEVKTIVNQGLSAGSYSVSLDASGLAGGTYIYRLEAAGISGKRVSSSKKMTLLK
jgi:hypothetical protein